MSMTITLPAGLETRVKEEAARIGRDASQFVIDTLEQSFKSGTSGPEERISFAHQPNGVSVESLLDLDYITECAEEADPFVTLEEVRQALSKIPGSMTEDFRAERDER